MINDALKDRVIQTADEYHFIGEDQWSQAIDLAPESEEAGYEFRRLVRAALQFYTRAFLVLSMVETDAEEQLDDLLDILVELEPEIGEFLKQNDAFVILDEESEAHLSRVFAVAEALRGLLLARSTQLAASIGTRFDPPSQPATE
jgi:hypothetical protein